MLKHLEEGDYDGIDEEDFLAYALTTHLQEVNQYQHLWVRWHANPLPYISDPLQRDSSWRAMERAAAEESSFGFSKRGGLPGGVGCLEISRFSSLDWG